MCERSELRRRPALAVRFEEDGNSRTGYFPSETDWTTLQTIHVHADF
jgi:hypothetical protein